MTMDDDRFESLYRQYSGRLTRGFRANNVPEGEVQDLVHDSLVRLLEHKDRIRAPEPWPFLKTIARTVLLNYVRSKKALKRSGRTVEIDDPENGQPLRSPERSQAENYEQTQKVDAMYRAIEELSEAQQQVILLQMEDKSYQQIADDLRITVDAVKSRRRDALRQLKARLKDFDWPFGGPEETP